jgi:hypothetical protein
MITMDGDWPIVVLDIAILTEFAILAYWFHRGSSLSSFKYLSLAYIIIGTSKLALIAGDALLALNYTAADFWLLARPWRALVWRIGSVTGLAIIIWILMFGSFDGGRHKKDQ